MRMRNCILKAAAMTLIMSTAFCFLACDSKKSNSNKKTKNKAVLTYDAAVKAAEEIGADEADDERFEDVIERFDLDTIYVAKQEDEAQELYDTYYNRFKDHPECDVSEAVIIYSREKVDEGKDYVVVYLFRIDDVDDAEDIFDGLADNLNFDNKVKKKDGISYSLYDQQAGSLRDLGGIYLDGPYFMEIRSRFEGEPDLINDLCDSLGIESPA